MIYLKFNITYIYFIHIQISLNELSERQKRKFRENVVYEIKFYAHVNKIKYIQIFYINFMKSYNKFGNILIEFYNIG